MCFTLTGLLLLAFAEKYATLVHKDIFEAAPVQRIWGLKKTQEKQLTTKQICNSMYTEANERSRSKENIQYGK